MKQALISPNEQVAYISDWILDKPIQPVFTIIPDAARVVEITEQPFEVASPLFWKICPNDCQSDFWYYNISIGQFKPIPSSAPMPQPVVEGAQTL